MNTAAHLAKHLRDFHFGGNWASVNLQQALESVSADQAMTPVGPLNTIAALVYHINYYVSAALQVLQDRPLNAKDAYSFDHPAILSEDDWQKLKEKG